jgi:hypothetical protein
MTSTTIAARRFWLGSFDGERLFYYLALGHAPTLDVALAKQAARRAHPSDVVIEQQDLERHGVVFGIGLLVRSAVDGAILPEGRLGGTDVAAAEIARAA